MKIIVLLLLSAISLIAGTTNLPNVSGRVVGVDTNSSLTALTPLQLFTTNNVSPNNVKWFGAVGDGTNDDTAAIQSAFDNGGSIYFPPGSYLISSLGPTNVDYVPILKLRSDSTIYGEGTLKLTATNILWVEAFMGVDQASPILSNVTIRGLTFSGAVRTGTNTAGPMGITLLTPHDYTSNAVNNITIENCKFHNIGSAVYILQRTTTGSLTRQVRKVRVSSCYGEECWGSLVTADGMDILINENLAYGNITGTGTEAYDAVSVHSGINVVISNNKFYNYANVSGSVINIRNNTNSLCGSKNIIITGNLIENAGAAVGVRISTQSGETTYGVSNVTVNGNIINGARSGLYISSSGVNDGPLNTVNFSGNVIRGATNGIQLEGTTARKLINISVNGNTVYLGSNYYGIYGYYLDVASIGNNQIITLSTNLPVAHTLWLRDLYNVDISGNYLMGFNYTATNQVYIIGMTESSFINNYVYGKWQISNHTNCHINVGAHLNDGYIDDKPINTGPNEYHNGKYNLSGSFYPILGTYSAGDMVWNRYAYTNGAPVGWICYGAGTPGVWQAIGSKMYELTVDDYIYANNAIVTNTISARGNVSINTAQITNQLSVLDGISVGVTNAPGAGNVIVNGNIIVEGYIDNWAVVTNKPTYGIKSAYFYGGAYYPMLGEGAFNIMGASNTVATIGDHLIDFKKPVKFDIPDGVAFVSGNYLTNKVGITQTNYLYTTNLAGAAITNTVTIENGIITGWSE